MSTEYVDENYYIDKSGKSPSKRVWENTSKFEKLLYFLYIWIFIPFLLILNIILFIPFLFFRKSRPLLPKSFDIDPSLLNKNKNKKTKNNYSENELKKYEWFGEGKELPLYTLFTPLKLGKNKGPGLHRRSWEMFNLFIEFYGMISKQGLQVGGCLSAIIIGYCQIRLIIHDLTDPKVVDYSQQVPITNYDPAERLRTDKDCAYGVGTGIANWANGREPLAWFTMYHIFLVILCLCLFGDELLNIRFGCFAPQWFRAGNGYTIMFLAVATLTTSPNWDWKETIQFRYFILLLIFIFGLYNVLRTLLTSVGITSEGYKHLDYRVGRKPLRFWTESEWLDSYFRQNFLNSKYERIFWTEKLQRKFGDWNFPLARRSKKDIKKQLSILKEEYGGDNNYEWDDARIQKVYQKTSDELYRQKGNTSRTIIHGGPKKLHGHFKRELEEMKRIHVGPIDPKNPPDEETEKKMIEDLNLDKGYFGIANWKPSTKSFAWWWFDIRRGYCMLCATALFFIRIGLCVFDLSSGTFNAYLSEYKDNQDIWKSNGGPDNSTCQYYKGSSVPIFILPSASAYSGVVAMYAWMSIWNMFLLGMCLAIFMVAISNNMWWGMHVGLIPITLIGPRMTSMSMGITLGLVAVATLQQGFWFNNDAGIIFTKIACYASIAGFAISLYPNEPLRPDFTRDPFWPWTSRFAFRQMDRKKWHYEFREIEDAG